MSHSLSSFMRAFFIVITKTAIKNDEEKKVLYRASFCSTVAEMTAPTGEGKRIAGYVLIALGISLWMVIWTQKYGKSFTISVMFFARPAES